MHNNLIDQEMNALFFENAKCYLYIKPVRVNVASLDASSQEKKSFVLFSISQELLHSLFLKNEAQIKFA